MGLRRKSREIALQFLFGHDFQERKNDIDSIEAELNEFCGCFETGKKALPYARKLITGICSQLTEIDKLLAAHSHNWRLERMSGVDRNILRIAVYEMRFSEDVPAKVAINEALELAKYYSISDSIPFINGVLDAVQADI
ncbi:MAG: transcription antitermination factor NusB [Desulfobulbaceae bacterium]|nr:transcription antitermination factor NusB [Desulfobulbaceae bacterium]